MEGLPARRKLFRNDPGYASVRLCDPSFTGERGFDDVDLSTATVAVGLGALDTMPTAGTFTIRSGSSSTVALPYNVTAAAMKAALTDISLNVGVTELTDGVYEIDFGAVGAQSLLAGTNNLLQPTSTISVSRLQTGTASVAEIQVLSLVQNPYCYALLSTAFPVAAAAVSILQTQTASLSAIKKLVLNPQPYGGTFMVTLDGTTFEAPYNANTSAMQALAGSNYTVVRRASNAWEFTRNTVNIAMTLSADVTNLLVPIGATGNLPLSTIGLYQAFANTEANSLLLNLAVQVAFASQSPRKIFQELIEVSRDLIGTGAIITPIYSTQLIIGQGDDLTVSTAGTTALTATAPFSQWFQLVNVSAGSGSYTRSLTLDNTNAVTGAIFRIELDVAASSNPTIRIYDRTTSGTLLQTVSGKGTGLQYFIFKARFDGTNWKKFEGEFVT